MRDPKSFTDLNSLKRYKAQRQAVKEATQALIQLLATQSRDERDGARDGLAEALMQEHPTLRQGAIGVLRDSCQEMRDLPVDMRSQASQQLIQRIADFDEPIPYI